MELPDDTIHSLMVSLGNAIRDVPKSDEQEEIVRRFFALVAYLESKRMIKTGSWNLGSLK